jgi:hypothetical protein
MINIIAKMIRPVVNINYVFLTKLRIK